MTLSYSIEIPRQGGATCHSVVPKLISTLTPKCFRKSRKCSLKIGARTVFLFIYFLNYYCGFTVQEYNKGNGKVKEGEE